ncbi:MAG: flagellar type III secretion system pore protein FliP [Vampirovibrionales bacterium]|nr:flagellar type III secretion system pore protein FliP [Vampirovibrionales bacterium]
MAAPDISSVLQTMDPALQLIVLMGSLSLIPFVFVSMTSFLRYIIVLSILKTALGTQQVPPSMVLVGMALILSLYTMGPVFKEMHDAAMPIFAKKGNVVLVLDAAGKPLKRFMMKHTREADVALFLDLAKKKVPDKPDDLSIWEVAPAFMISELRTSFEIGFVLFIPFIVLDMVVANILLALGMFMLSPTIISLPFKILIFVAVDGWRLIMSGLAESFM